MSNAGEDWRKFVQTFFLAEQPNGYFVLNDIFRFLKEETVESDAEPEVEHPAQIPVVPVPEHAAPPVVAEILPERTPSPAPPSPVQASPELPAAEPPTTISEIPESPVATPAPLPPSAPVPSSRPNGIHAQEPEKQAASAPAAVVPTETTRSPAPRSSTATPAAAPTPPPAAAPAPTSTPAPPAAPKSWAHLAASNSKKWGSAVAQESRGTSQVLPSPATSGMQTPNAPAVGPSHNGPQQGAGPFGGRNAHPALVAAQTVTTAQCFIKVCCFPC